MREAITLQWLRPVLFSRITLSLQVFAKCPTRSLIRDTTFRSSPTRLASLTFKLRRAKVHRIVPFRPETDAKVGLSACEQQETRLFIVGRAGRFALSAAPWIGSYVYQ
jgi:hypothetical protein